MAGAGRSADVLAFVSQTMDEDTALDLLSGDFSVTPAARQEPPAPQSEPPKVKQPQQQQVS